MTCLPVPWEPTDEVLPHPTEVRRRNPGGRRCDWHNQGACVLTTSVTGKAHAGAEIIKTGWTSLKPCNGLIPRMAVQLGVVPIDVIETSVLRMVGFPTSDGSDESILITRSRPDSEDDGRQEPMTEIAKESGS